MERITDIIETACEQLEIPVAIECSIVDCWAADLTRSVDWKPEEDVFTVELVDGSRVRFRGSLLDNVHCTAYIPGAGWDFIDEDDAAAILDDFLAGYSLARGVLRCEEPTQADDDQIDPRYI